MGHRVITLFERLATESPSAAYREGLALSHSSSRLLCDRPAEAAEYFGPAV